MPDSLWSRTFLPPRTAAILIATTGLNPRPPGDAFRGRAERGSAGSEHAQGEPVSDDQAPVRAAYAGLAEESEEVAARREPRDSESERSGSVSVREPSPLPNGAEPVIRRALEPGGPHARGAVSSAARVRSRRLALGNDDDGDCRPRRTAEETAREHAHRRTGRGRASAYLADPDVGIGRSRSGKRGEENNRNDQFHARSAKAARASRFIGPGPRSRRNAPREGPPHPHV
jgi:hypothetical protein